MPKRLRLLRTLKIGKISYNESEIINDLDADIFIGQEFSSKHLVSSSKRHDFIYDKTKRRGHVAAGRNTIFYDAARKLAEEVKQKNLREILTRTETYYSKDVYEYVVIEINEETDEYREIETSNSRIPYTVIEMDDDDLPLRYQNIGLVVHKVHHLDFDKMN